MARFDSGVTYDSSAKYDAVPPPQPFPKTKHMATPHLELQKKSDTELRAFAELILSGMTGNPNFATPFPALTDVSAQLAAYAAALLDHDNKHAAAENATTLKDNQRELLERLITRLANYVDNVADGDAVIIQSANIPVRDTAAPVGQLPPPGNLRARASLNDGQVDLDCEPCNGASTYEWQCRLHVDGQEYVTVKTSTSSRIELTGLTPGALYAFRVRAIGAAGPGIWSDEAVERAP